SAPAHSHLFRYVTGGPLRILVLPDANDQPTCVGEATVGLRVALTITPDLHRPDFGVGGGFGVMLRTAVPEAAVEEHGHLGPGEDHVCGSPNRGMGRADTR